MEQKSLKLNYKRTFIVGLAFFTILMMWQVYNNYFPLFLKELLISHYGPKGVNGAGYDYIIGIIMAIDNLLALFMLPLFGTLSDKTKSKMGKRMPYIIAGTIATIALFPFIAFLYIKNSLIGVAVMMGLVLICMNIYRNPAVSLMPDMTPKPLRSKANAIINLVGYIGAIFAGIIALFFPYNKSTVIVPFLMTSVFMLIALIVLVLKIRENKIAEEMAPEMKLGEEFSESLDNVAEDKPLSKRDTSNLWIIIASVFLWFFAFNAVETFWTTYSQYYLGISKWSLATIILTISSIVAFVPAGIWSQKIGRKKIIIIGLVILIGSLIACAAVGELTPKFAASLPWQFYLMLVLFACAGIGWAFINVNSYPMIVEMANKDNVGKYTGYYYTSSMLAQTITPVIIGSIMGALGYKMFFAYAAIFMAIALIVFVFVKNPKFAKFDKDGKIELVKEKPIIPIKTKGNNSDNKKSK